MVNFSRHDVDLKWMLLVESPFENPGYEPAVSKQPPHSATPGI